VVSVSGETHRSPEGADGIVGPLDAAGGEGLIVADGPDCDASTEGEQGPSCTELCAHGEDEPGPGPMADGMQWPCN